MLFAIGGLIIALKNKKPYALSILIFLPVFVYVVFSWWCWWYGGSYGSRPMVDIYALLALPMGAAFNFIGQQKWFLKSPLIIVIVLMIALNLFQTAQKRTGYLHHSWMTEKAYWSNFLSLEDAGGFWDNTCPTDDSKAILGEEEYNTLHSLVAHWRARGIIK
jgi:hypothetical protein